MILDFEHGDSERQVYLRRGEPYADVLAHRVDHVVEQALEFGRVNALRRNRLRDHPQRLVTKTGDLQNHRCYLSRSSEDARLSPVWRPPRHYRRVSYL